MKRIDILYALMLPLLVVLALQGCIREDLSECPEPQPPVTPTDGGKLVLHLADSLIAGSEARGVAVYLFDQDDKYYTSRLDYPVTFSDEYRQEFTLPAGKYRAVVWVNEPEAITIYPSLTKSATTYDEMRLKLADLQTTDVRTWQILDRAAPLFFSQENNIDIEDGQTTERRLTCIKDTKAVRLTVRFHRKADGKLCNDFSHRRGMYDWIQSREGILRFDNQPEADCPQFYFCEKPVYETVADSTSLNASFTLLRLMQDSETRLILTNFDTLGNNTTFYSHELMDLIRATGQYNTQAAIDREDTFHIELDFVCDHFDPVDPDNPDDPDKPDKPDDPDDPDEPDTPDPPTPPVDPDKPVNPWLSVTITVNGWVLRNMDTDL